MADNFIGQSGLPLGLQNNNPGDLRPGDDWQGMIGTNGGFIVFQDITWGLRAMARDLTNKINKGENTITAIVNVYAPASDNNDVPAYVSAVSSDTGFDPNAVLGTDQGTVHSLIRAFMNHEIGDDYSAMVSDADIDQGISMANNTVTSLVQATGIAVQNAVATDPTTVYVGVGAGLLILWLLLRKR